MSETTPVTGSAEMADEPSMEDILASIRKIIADDEPVVEPETKAEVATAVAEQVQVPEVKAAPAYETPVPDTPSALPADASFADHMSVAASAPVETVPDITDFDAELDGLMAELDGSLTLENTPVIAQPVTSFTDINDVSSDVSAPSDELVDLDIEALLSEVDVSSEALIPQADNLSVSADDFDEELDSILELEIPAMEEEISTIASVEMTDAAAAPIASPVATSELSDSIDDHDVMALLDSLGAEIDVESASAMNNGAVPNIDATLHNSSVQEASVSEDDNLFDDLESLLTEPTEPEQSLDVQPQTETLNEIVADVAPLDEVEAEMAIDATDVDISESDLNSLLDDLILEADDDLMSDEAMPTLAEHETVVTSESLSLPKDGTDMSLVKSLMADLTEPEAPLVQNVTQNDGESELDALISDVETNDLASDFDMSALFDEDIANEDTAIEPARETTDIAEEDTSNVLDDILNMSLEDEFASHDSDLDALLEIPEAEPELVSGPVSEPIIEAPTLESVLADEAENMAAAELPETQAVKTKAVKNKSVKDNAAPSALGDIAREAEQDANEVDALLEALETQDLSDETVEDIDAALDGMISGDVDTVDMAISEVVENVPTAEHSTDAVALEDAVSKGPAPKVARKKKTKAKPKTKTRAKRAIKELPKETADMPKAALNTDAILDEVTEEASVSAFASLNSIVEENAIREERGDRIGDLVMDALRPMLKEWLDANLKGIVERAVTKEVKRISSGK